MPPPAGSIAVVPAESSMLWRWQGSKDSLHIYWEPSLVARVAELKGSLSPLSQHGLKRKHRTMNEQISAWPLNANAASFLQNPKPLLVNQESIKMATKIEQFSYAQRVVVLTHQYLELRLPLDAALRAAEADLR
jgi:hypothetical protein